LNPRSFIDLLQQPETYSNIEKTRVGRYNRYYPAVLNTTGEIRSKVPEIIPPINEWNEQILIHVALIKLETLSRHQDITDWRILLDILCTIVKREDFNNPAYLDACNLLKSMYKGVTS
jgi:hypothetical protein